MTTLVASLSSFITGAALTLLFYYVIAPRVHRFRWMRMCLGRVFASYAREDKEKVNLIGQIVKGLGGEFVSDRTHILGGDDWRDKINELIRGSDKFQLFWSKNSMESEEVKNEWRYALSLKRKKFICPIFWEKGLELPHELSRLQFVHVNIDPVTKEASVAQLGPSWNSFKRLPINVIVVFVISVASVMGATFWAVNRAIRDGAHNQGTPTPISSPERSTNSNPVLAGSPAVPESESPSDAKVSASSPETAVRTYPKDNGREPAPIPILPLIQDSIVYGKLSAPDGSPIQGAVIAIDPSTSSEEETKTDQDGRFKLLAPSEPGKTKVAVKLTDASTGSIRSIHKVVADVPGELTLTLREDGEIQADSFQPPFLHLYYPFVDYSHQDGKRGGIRWYGFNVNNYGGVASDVKFEITVPQELHLIRALMVEPISIDSKSGDVIEGAVLEKLRPIHISSNQSNRTYLLVEKFHPQQSRPTTHRILRIETRLRRNLKEDEKVSVNARIASCMDQKGRVYQDTAR